MTLKKSFLYDTSITATIQPTWLGIIGGGQLGRMFTQAAQAMGYKVAVLEKKQDCPAGQVADLQIYTNDIDKNGLYQLSSLCAAITIEFENVSTISLSKLAKKTYVSPSATSISIAQDRIAEKCFFTKCQKNSNIKPTPYCIISSEKDIKKISQNLLPGILKISRMGYDGKGQIRVNNIQDVTKAFLSMHGVTCILEKILPIAYEISVLIVRSEDGTTAIYPIAENIHKNNILFTTTVPSPNISNVLAVQAKNAAITIISYLDYVGVLCIEFFILKDGTLIINEMAPRPHNSGHYTINACSTSQFEQQVRTMMRLPLGETYQHSAAIMLNILGENLLKNKQIQLKEPVWNKILELSGAHLYLYNKTQIYSGRKIGHITFTASNLQKAKIQLIKACAILDIPL